MVELGAGERKNKERDILIEGTIMKLGRNLEFSGIHKYDPARTLSNSGEVTLTGLSLYSDRQLP